MSIRYDTANKRSLTPIDRLSIAKTIVKTSKRDVLELIGGIKNGTEILRLLERPTKLADE
jgi:hypothetical protein